ncbi:MAG: hypothetical protein FD136_998 [Chitinophagaceae bacterium]|nr:MAG: hypothetical protein FD136_998 [Chitinophagaceae bacterium]
MYKSLFSLYLVIFCCYLLFTRIPDFFDGEKYPATITFLKDSTTNILLPQAKYSIGINKYVVAADYPLVKYTNGEQVEVIVEHEHPEKAAVYRFWGYWISWEELLASVVAAVLLFQVALSITNNPTPEAILEQLSYKEEKKTKYD